MALQLCIKSKVHCLDLAAQRLTAGDESGACKALGKSRYTQRSPGGQRLMRALAKALEIEQLELPWHEGPRLCGPSEIEALLPLFKQFAPAAELLAKAGASEAGLTLENLDDGAFKPD